MRWILQSNGFSKRKKEMREMRKEEIKFETIISPRRRSIGIFIYPDCTVQVRVPKGVSERKINEIVRLRGDWIIKKLEHFRKNPRLEIKKKEYIDDEEFFYLGKRYKLKITQSNRNSIQIVGEFILIESKKLGIKAELEKWFMREALVVFSERLVVNFEIFSREFRYNFPILKLRKMRARWGSMSNRGVMTLNYELIHTELSCIDYVIMHELCHLRHQDHSKKFYDLQERFTPNYKELKRRLNEFMHEVKDL